MVNSNGENALASIIAYTLCKILSVVATVGSGAFGVAFWCDTTLESICDNIIIISDSKTHFNIGSLF